MKMLYKCFKNKSVRFFACETIKLTYFNQHKKNKITLLSRSSVVYKFVCPSWGSIHAINWQVAIWCIFSWEFYFQIQSLSWFLKIKLPHFSRLSYSKLVIFSKQNAKNQVIFQDILTTKASIFLLNIYFAIFTFYGAYKK